MSTSKIDEVRKELQEQKRLMLENLLRGHTGCNNCKWLNKRYQKCSCCVRKVGLKDCYEV